MCKLSEIVWTNERRKLADLLPWPRNPRQIREAEAERLAESVETFGQVETLAIGPGNEVYNGHQRLNVLMAKHGPDYEVDVRVSSRALTEKEREKLTVYLHKGAAGEWDFDILANEFDVDDLLAWGFEDWELGTAGWETPPSLDELADEYGDPQERDFWPFIRVQVSPETYDLWKSLMAQLPGEDEAAKMGQILGAVDAAVLSSILP